MEIRDLLNKYEFPGDDIPIVRGSALKALESDEDNDWTKGIMDLMQACDDYIPAPEREVDFPFLMPIEDVFTITGRGTVVTGRVEKGIIRPGDEVEIVGIKDTHKTVATSLEMFRKILDDAEAGDNVGILLRGVGKDDVERGQVLAKPGQHQAAYALQSEVYVLKKEEEAVTRRSSAATSPSSTSVRTDITARSNLQRE